MSGGRRGPAPKPTALRLLEGTHLERVNPDEPQPRAALPELDEGASAEVAAVFDRLVTELEAMGIAHASDSDSLRCFCEAVVVHRKASALIAKSNVLIPGLHGGPVRNPALAVQRDAAQTIRAFAQEFGLTPSARSRITTGATSDAAQDNPFAGAG